MVLTSSQGPSVITQGPSSLLPSRAELSKPGTAFSAEPGCPAGQQHSESRESRGFPGHSEQPHALSRSLGGEKEVGESQAGARGQAAKNTEVILQDNGAGDALAAAWSPQAGWGQPYR